MEKEEEVKEETGERKKYKDVKEEWEIRKK